ncbi:uncharacterized protein LOC119767570 [Culex quinquefasciatus]|uniref:Short form D7clu32 salivary protein n=1 Tax=Culex quinquefasciatus TaxID=7176 RepID=Q95V91_CULQU|nr:uncharacterized protein LOC119767570 [Culex quinquefasciatus]AAL16048.1 short form D7clu32 salivary protein [Culex quinquefasciatus]
MKYQSIYLAFFSLGFSEARFTNLGIEEFYIKKCEEKIVYTTDHGEICDMRSLEVVMDTEENKNYIGCVFRELGYFNAKGQFDKQALIKDYHQAGVKNRDKAVLESYQSCMQHYGPTTNPMKILDCVTQDKDFPKVMNARRDRNSKWKPDWMVAHCGAKKLF